MERSVPFHREEAKAFRFCVGPHSEVMLELIKKLFGNRVVALTGSPTKSSG